MDLKTNYKDIALPKTLYENYIEDKLEQDLIIPDYYCSAQKIVHCEADAVIHSKNITDDKVIFEGVCTWRLLYLSDEDNALHHITCEREFTEIFSAPSVNGCVRYKIKPKNVLCKLQSASRAECKAMLCLAVKIEGQEEQKLLAGSAEDCLQLKEEKTTHYEMKANCEKEFSLTGEISLKRRQEYDIYKIIPEIILRESKCYDGKIVIKGICKNKVILLSKDDCDAETVEIETAFTQLVESDAVCEGWYACMHCHFADSDASFVGEGEENVLTVRNTVIASIDVYCKREVSVISDAYHLERELDCQRQEFEMYRDIQETEALTHLSQRVHLDTKDMSVLYFESHSEIEKIDVQEGVMVIDGTLKVCCAYALNNSVYHKSFSFPFQSTRQLDHPFERLKCEAYAGVDNFNFIILSDTEMEIGCDVRISMTIYTLGQYNGIVDLQAGEPKSEKILKTPLVVYYGSKEENLWEICKKYSVPISTVMENNELTNETLLEDQLIFITKH